MEPKPVQNAEGNEHQAGPPVLDYGFAADNPTPTLLDRVAGTIGLVVALAFFAAGTVFTVALYVDSTYPWFERFAYVFGFPLLFGLAGFGVCRWSIRELRGPRRGWRGLPAPARPPLRLRNVLIGLISVPLIVGVMIVVGRGAKGEAEVLERILIMLLIAAGSCIAVFLGSRIGRKGKRVS